MRLLKLLLRRLLVLGLGLATIALIVFGVFEPADRRLPLVLALSITYGMTAYIILPRAIRMGLKILQRRLVPSYTVTPDGLPGDPVNIALIGTLAQLRSAFAKLGWTEADHLGLVRAFVLWETLQLTHATDSDANAERNHIIAELTDNNCIEAVRELHSGEHLPEVRINHYMTDGEITLACLAGEIFRRFRMSITYIEMPRD